MRRHTAEDGKIPIKVRATLRAPDQIYRARNVGGEKYSSFGRISESACLAIGTTFFHRRHFLNDLALLRLDIFFFLIGRARLRGYDRSKEICANRELIGVNWSGEKRLRTRYGMRLKSRESPRIL